MAAPGLESSLTATVWTPSGLGADEAAPLLVVHDGPEYAALGGLTHYLGTAIASGSLPPLRAALLGPADRNEWYSANPTYATLLCIDLMAALDELAPTTVRVGRRRQPRRRWPCCTPTGCTPSVFDALLLQSGSFFTPGARPAGVRRSRASRP